MGAGETAGPRAAFDPERLERATFGDAALRAELLGMFETQLKDALPVLRIQAGEHRWRLAHGIKGAARGLGAYRLADCAAAMERDPHDEALVERFGLLAGDVLAYIAGERG
jgi:HPt (histidine-containing phosphotransfer) domain-containing protein